MTKPVQKSHWIKKYWLWFLWLTMIVFLSGYFLSKLLAAEDKSNFLIGESTYGHHQIEMACNSCHTEAFGGKEVLQDACVNCHAEDLDAGHDSHPKKKFTDPRNASNLEILDARYCISCHTEHQHEQTRAMGVTIPDDYCFHCHTDIGEERESHQGLAFDSCASAGCHNFHDNRALYESFLVQNSQQAWLLAVADLPAANNAKKSIDPGLNPLSVADSDGPSNTSTELIANEWAHSSHAAAGVNCSGCHSDSATQTWIEKPAMDQCKTCHEYEAKTFTEGKHGMRLASGVSGSLENISPSESHLEFKDSAMQKHQSCTGCHKSHTFDRAVAAVESCLDCHNDEHSVAFEDSPHGKIWFQSIQNETDTSGLVSCASCHMPRTQNGKLENRIVSVNHNQNFNLRPNEKMIRSVCMNCHGLSFAINSLADPQLIKSNFSGKPNVDIPSIEWATKREHK